MFAQMKLQKYPDLRYEALKNNSNATPMYGPFEKLFVSDWGQSKIHSNVVQAFGKMNIRRMVPIQQNSFLYLINNYNTAMVGFSKGKSTAYLVSIFSSILNSRGDNETEVGIGPKAIVLCSSLGSCSILEGLSKKLISPSKDSIKVVVAYATMPVQNIIAHICNGCDVLIATPASLHNLLNKTKIFSWMNLRHIVFDNIDLLLENYKDQMVYFYKILIQLKENISNLQMISASVKWTKDVDDFLNRLFVKWQYIFGSHLEAARYMKIELNFVNFKDDKSEKILEYLRNCIKCRRIVLFTSNTSELSKISNYIQQNESDIEVLLPNQMKSAKSYSLQKWDMPLVKKQIILICSDDMMFDFYIENADCVIHYDIPENKQHFSTRFSVLQDSSNTLISKERSSYIFLSNSNNDMLQLPKVVEIMKEFGNGEVEPILQKHSMIITKTLEKQKVNSLLCIDVQQFGDCPKPTVCQSRHILIKELEEPGANIPNSGLAIIKVIKVYDASHMSAKLLKLNCTSDLNDGKHWSKVKDHSKTNNLKLNMFYSNPDSRILHENPKLGDTVAVQLDIKIREDVNTEYFRAIIIDLVDINTTNPKVKVKLIDEGFVDIVSKWKVFVLPDTLKSLETNTVDIFLASVKPIDFDKIWCSQANAKVKKELQYAEDCNDTIIVKVQLALGTTLWIKKLTKKYWNSNLKKDDFEDILPDFLLNIGYADKNFDHLPKLTELCNSVGINLPFSFKHNVDNHELSVEEFMSFYKLPKPQWAHLDKCSATLVTLNYIISPILFFVLNTKYYDRVKDLQEKINNYVVQKQGSKLKHIIKGAIGLAQHPDTIQYGRIQIIEVFDDKFVEVLFVDLGEFHEIKTNLLLTIESNLITQLPFQAIECSLSGVMDILPTGVELEELRKYIFDYTDQLYIKVFDTISSATFTGGNHYEVILYDENNTVNFDFETNFPQYCDSIKMSKLIDLFCNEDEDIVEKHDDVVPQSIFEERISEIENNVEVADLDSAQLFFHQFGLAVLGPVYNDLIETLESNDNISNKESSVKIETIDETSCATQVEENKCITDLTSIKPIKEVLSVDITEEVKDNTPNLKKSSSVLKNQKLNSSKKSQIRCLTCNTNALSIVPVCNWYQNKNYVYLKFNILEMDDFNIESTMHSITLSAQFNDMTYNFCANLFGLVKDDNITHKNNFEGIHIKAEKLYKTDYKWPRLLKCEKRHNYVKYDVEHIEESNGKISLIRILNKYKLLALGTPLNNVNDEAIDSDTSNSDLDANFDDIVDD